MQHSSSGTTQGCHTSVLHVSYIRYFSYFNTCIWLIGPDFQVSSEFFPTVKSAYHFRGACTVIDGSRNVHYCKLLHKYSTLYIIRVTTRISFQNSLTFPWLSFIFPWPDKCFKYNITVLAVVSGHFKMYVALSPNYGLCKSAQKNNINNLVQIAHSDCLITTIILQISYQPWKKYRNLKEFPVK